MITARPYLLRSWGGNLAKVVALRTPDAYEPPDQRVACWWFATAAERQAFVAVIGGITNVMRDRVNPGLDEQGEEIDTPRSRWRW